MPRSFLSVVLSALAFTWSCDSCGRGRTEDAAAVATEGSETAAAPASDWQPPGNEYATPTSAALSPAPSGVVESEPSRPTLAWNAWWVEGGELGFAAVPQLRASTDYALVLDLSQLAYDAPGVVSSSPSADLATDIHASASNPAGPDRIGLHIVAIVDTTYFDTATVAAPPTELGVNLVPLREQRSLPDLRSADLRSQFGAASLGATRIKLRTGTKAGLASVAITVWRNDRPIDEFVVLTCVGDDPIPCTTDFKAMGNRARALGGKPSLLLGGAGGLRRSMIDGPLSEPDGALHLLQPTTKLVGIFRRKEWPQGKYEVWRLGRSADELQDYFERTMRAAFDKSMGAPTEAQLAVDGSSLLNVLFDTPGANSARKAFERFVLDHVAASEKRAPSLFLRVIGVESSAPIWLPLGMAAVRKDGRPQFLGFRFRIETPLRHQYHEAGACMSRWVLAMPNSNDDELEEAWEHMKDVPPWSGLRSTHEDVAETREWLGDDQSSEPSSLLVFVAHHDRDMLTYGAGSEHIVSADVARQFTHPSAVILGGCGTGMTGSDFVRRMNARGVAAAITTSTKVSGPMVGAFLGCWARVNASTVVKTLSQAYFDAVSCLREEFGPKALSFALLGNGDITLCEGSQ
jgi:hypothetical protein